MRLFIFMGLQRCGTHALVNWLLQQRPWVVQPKECIGPSTFYHHTDIESIYYFNFQQMDKSLIEQRGPELVSQAFENYNDVVVAFEDGDINIYDEDRLFEGCDLNDYEIIRVISLRDCWNCFASFYKKYNDVPIHIQRIWEERAEEILGRTNWLEKRFKFLNYNEWVISKEYRQQMAQNLGLYFTDEGINDVLSFGNGSSFTEQNMHGHGSDMPVLSRYRDFINDIRFIRYITPYKNQLSKKVFQYDGKPDE